MDPNTKDKTLENLTKSENILIIVSKDSGFDGLAAGLALYLSLAKLGKNITILAQNPTVGQAQRIYGVDRIGKDGASKNPVVVIKNAVETVDKVTYYLDEDQLKVVIHPLPGSEGVNRDQISFEYGVTQPNLVFTIGFDSPDALEREITHEHKISPETWLIAINNRELRQKFAQEEFVNTQATCLSEVTARVLQELALPLDEDIAYNLYAAISDSTNSFSPARASAQTFEIASWLVKFGAGRASFAQLDYDQFQKRPQLPSLNPVDFLDDVAPIDQVEKAPQTSRDSKDWLKPPKIYKGSKSFNGENKG